MEKRIFAQLFAEENYKHVVYINFIKQKRRKEAFYDSKDVDSILTRVGITPVQGNVVSAFVGEECRGTEMLSPYGNTSLTIYGSTQGESVTLKYYDAATGHLFTIPDIVKM